MKEFQDKRVVVTGATKGIGAAVVARFRAEGAKVIGAARTLSEAQKRSGDYVAADITRAADVSAVAAQVLETLGGVDVIVHVAGGSSSKPGGFAAADEAAWEEALSLNLLAAVRLDRALVPSMIRQKSGVIVHVGSTQARMPLYDSTLAYAAAKGALRTYSKGLSNELGPKGVRVMSVAPGFTETDAAARMIERMAEKAGKSQDAAREDLMHMLGGIPIGRPNTPEEVADLIAFVASSRAATLTGTEFLIDGGTVASV